MYLPTYRDREVGRYLEVGNSTFLPYRGVNNFDRRTNVEFSQQWRHRDEVGVLL